MVSDFEFWYPRLKPGGMIGFHDIAGQAAGGWKRIRNSVDHAKEIVHHQTTGNMGIGLIVKPVE